MKKHVSFKITLDKNDRKCLTKGAVKRLSIGVYAVDFPFYFSCPEHRVDPQIAEGWSMNAG